MRNLTLLLVILLFPVGVWAGETERRQLAGEIMDAQGLPQQVAELQARFTRAALGEVEGLDLGEEQKAFAKELRSAVLDELAREIDWASIKGDIADIYVREYSEAELRQIRDFLTSPAGKKYRDKIPLIKEHITALTREKMLKAMPEILARVSKHLLEKSQK